MTDEIPSNEHSEPPPPYSGRCGHTLDYMDPNQYILSWDRIALHITPENIPPRVFHGLHVLMEQVLQQHMAYDTPQSDLYWAYFYAKILNMFADGTSSRRFP